MDYLSLSRDSFDAWVQSVGIKPQKFEFSSRTYYVSGEFFYHADKNEVERLKELHGNKWYRFYSKYNDILPYLNINKEKKKVQEVKQKYKPKSVEISDFINKLKQ